MSASAAQAPHEQDEAQRFVQAVLSAKQLPAFVRNIRMIATVATDLQVKVALLEKEIVKDPALTGRVLRVASAASRGAQIGSVKQAIILLGYERVSNLSASAAVFDKLERNSGAVQDLLVMSVLTANQALALAVQAGHGRPEMAYMCGLFSNLGEVMTACHRVSDYLAWSMDRSILSPPPDGSEAAHFGFAFGTVAVLLAKAWGLPTEVVQSQHRLQLDGRVPKDRLLHIAQFSADVTRSVHASTAAPVDNPEVGEIIDRYAASLAVDRKAVHAALREAQREAGPALRQMELTLDGWRRARIADAAQAAAGRSDGAVPRPGDEQAAGGTSPDTGEEPTFAGAVRTALETALGCGYARGVLALSNATFTQVRGRIGLGRGHAKLLSSFEVGTGNASTPLGLALDQRADIMVDLRSDRALPYRSDPMLPTLRPRSFALLPLVLANRLIGCLYFDCPDLVDADDGHLDLLRDSRDRLVAFIQSSKSGTGL
jgi:HD-like signal output (HDOD) protein